ncbi:YajQ family cyclic di-GMP-binding protein [Sulfurospirillum arcachonense]|uniref:YajQ family cyclic di-GMP-binding protein n=1 Tax=Sulfurospirillum arcachonense TaxID=57666 RepID=UPI00046A93A1|nr:YajQ family cyclic di-GMP-binding protein [Sulfurospirillum arcachonense]
MAKEHSFDITAEIDKQILKDAYEQAKKIITNRWDFKGITADFDYNEKGKTITLVSATDSKAEAMFDAIVSEAIKRGISAKGIKEASRDTVGGGNTKIIVSINDTLSKEDSKTIVKKIKDLKLKVQASIRGEEVRVVGKSIDDLQTAIQALREAELEIPLNFINMK